MHERGTCPYKQSDRHDCHGRRTHPTAVCNTLAETHDICPHYYRMASLRDSMPGLWGEVGKDVCCDEYRYMMLWCAETFGHRAGAVDILIYPNDGKDVWRNYQRRRFLYCPFCGQKARPSFAVGSS